MTIQKLRHKIDQIDDRIVNLLNERAKASLSIGKIKLKENISVFSPEREKKVLDHIKSANSGPISNEALGAIYREVMSSSLSLEKSLTIACLGQKGSFSSKAATAQFGSQVKYWYCESIQEVFQRVEQDDCDYGVVPIENSVEGAVTHTFDLLVDSDLKICKQTQLKISHNLLSRLRDCRKVKKIYSHPQVFGQCRNWIFNHLPNAEHIHVDSTTQAGQMAAKNKNSAAIASVETGEIYKLNVLKSDIQDIAHNMTRFLVIAKQDVPPTGRDRTSILFSIKDRVGALHAMLTPFFKNKINLTRIESRPFKKRAWDYYFFVDLEGHRLESKVKKALDQLEGMCKYLKILGSYPVAE